MYKSTEQHTRFKNMTPEKLAKIKGIKLKNLACIFRHNINDVVNVETTIFNTLSLKAVVPTTELVSLLSEIRHKWDIELIAVGRDWNGDTYFKSYGYTLETPCLQRELSEKLGKEHYEYFLNQIPPKQRINLVWVATPYASKGLMGNQLYLRKVMNHFDVFKSTGNLVDRDQTYQELKINN